jgi:hypothetical protein
LIGSVGEVLSALRGDNTTVTGTNESHNSVQQRKEEARRKRRKKKRTGSSLVSSCFQGTGFEYRWFSIEVMTKLVQYLHIHMPNMPFIAADLPV